MTKDKGIPISPQHGVNPSICLCAFCRKPKGIALLGRLPKDEEAPKEVISDYEPCDECKEHFAKGVLIVEVTETPNGTYQPPIAENAYPTGRWFVADEKYFSKESGLKKGRKALMLQSEYNQIAPTQQDN